MIHQVQVQVRTGMLHCGPLRMSDSNSVQTSIKNKLQLNIAIVFNSNSQSLALGPLLFGTCSDPAHYLPTAHVSSAYSYAYLVSCFHLITSINQIELKPYIIKKIEWRNLGQ